jgi:hypothetical protein
MISQDQAKAIMDQVFAECQMLRNSGQKEYAHEVENALRNFEQTGRDLELPREKILWIFTKKHSDGVLAWINGHRSQRENVRGRINDMIVYLVLLRCMVEDDERSVALADRRERPETPILNEIARSAQ